MAARGFSRTYFLNSKRWTGPCAAASPVVIFCDSQKIFNPRSIGFSPVTPDFYLLKISGLYHTRIALPKRPLQKIGQLARATPSNLEPQSRVVHQEISDLEKVREVSETPVQ